MNRKIISTFICTLVISILTLSSAEALDLKSLPYVGVTPKIIKLSEVEIAIILDPCSDDKPNKLYLFNKKTNRIKEIQTNDSECNLFRSVVLPSKKLAYLDRKGRIFKELDPYTGTVKNIGNTLLPRHDAKLATLPNGKIFVMGGLEEVSTDSTKPTTRKSYNKLRSAELFDPKVGLSVLIPGELSIEEDRYHELEVKKAILSNNGKLLIQYYLNGLVDIYDYKSNSLSHLSENKGQMQLKLQDGTILFADEKDLSDPNQSNRNWVTVLGTYNPEKNLYIDNFAELPPGISISPSISILHDSPIILSSGKVIFMFAKSPQESGYLSLSDSKCFLVFDPMSKTSTVGGCMPPPYWNVSLIPLHQNKLQVIAPSPSTARYPRPYIKILEFN